VPQHRSNSSARGASSGKADCASYTERSPPTCGIFPPGPHHRCNGAQAPRQFASPATCSGHLQAIFQQGSRSVCSLQYLLGKGDCGNQEFPLAQQIAHKGSAHILSRAEKTDPEKPSMFVSYSFIIDKRSLYSQF